VFFTHKLKSIEKTSAVDLPSQKRVQGFVESVQYTRENKFVLLSRKSQERGVNTQGRIAHYIGSYQRRPNDKKSSLIRHAIEGHVLFQHNNLGCNK
jgi:hypothetical protein